VSEILNKLLSVNIPACFFLGSKANRESESSTPSLTIMLTMKNESAIKDKFSIPEYLKVERKRSKIVEKNYLTATFRKGFKSGESPVETFFQVVFCVIGFDFSQSDVG
jgi:hypothetical protein